MMKYIAAMQYVWNLATDVDDLKVAVLLSLTSGLAMFLITILFVSRRQFVKRLAAYRRGSGQTRSAKHSTGNGGTDNGAGVTTLEPIHFLEVFAAVITIMDAAKDAAENLFSPTVAQVRSKSRDLNDVPDSEIQEAIDFTIRLRNLDEKFIDRINNKCLPPYYKAIDDGTNEDVDEEKAVAKRCVCHALKNIRDMNGGRLPTDELRDLWRRFDCGMIV